MIGNWSSQQNEVRRLSAAAGLAVQQELTCRSDIISRARRAAKSGKFIGLAALAGFAIVSIARRGHDHDEADARAREPLAGVVASAGNRLLDVMQLVLMSWKLWTSVTSDPGAPASAERARDA